MALEIGKNYYIKNVATGKYLNVYGTDTVANSRNVNTYAKEDCLAQKWTVGLYGNGARVYTAINSAYALNINTSNNNCTMYLAASNSEADSVVDFLTVSASNNQYRIKMMAYGLYLSVTTSDDNAYWASSADSYSLWQLEEVSTSSTIVTTAPTALVDQTFFVKNYNTGYNLNVYGTDTVADERNVNVYSKENCLAQKWIVRQKTDGAKLCTAINENFVLNINTGTNNCSMHTESTNDSEDCVLEFVPYTDATVTSADKVYRIKMANHNLYLDVESAGSGANAYWVSGTSGYSLWQFITEEDMFPTAPDAPSEIVGSTFAIKAHGTNFNLNVHGTDTVVDERNVNIYSKEDCLAQRWVVKNTDTGPKLYTKINEDFAINHYTVDDNCTMYTDSTDNDEDSILEFQKVSDMLYRIKLFNSDKYMTIDGTATSGSNVIWSDTASTATLWEFIPEATMFPTPAAAPTAIVGSTFFIKNFYTGYNLNVHGTDTVANGRNVNVYSKENCLAQKWQVIQTDRGPKIVTAIDSTFALNIYSEDNPNCTMYKADVSNIDTVLEFEPYTDATTTAEDKIYKIKMFHHGKYLEAAGVGSGYNAFWSDSPTYPLWQFVTEEDMFPPAEEAADGIIDRTFFIQNVNTGYFLNINGNETVSNTAQVNVYAKENVQAQRWIIRNTTAGPKMLTKLNENFALNIYAKDNNCTMYDAAVSDTDTVLEIIPYSEADNIYRIKMHYHGRYLTVSNLSIGAKAYWTAVDTEPCALWKLIPESEMTFDTAVDTDTTPDSTLVNKFIPAVAGNYMVGRNGRQISEITIHHMAGNMSIESLGAMWQNSAEGASSHYGINGLNVGQYVKECNTAYTNGGTPIDPDAESSNYRAITIEVANSVASGDYPVSEDSYRRLYELVADIARRNNLGTLVPGQNLTWHSMYSYTECPGDYLRSKMQDIADRANALNSNAVFIRKLGTQYPLVLADTQTDEGYGVSFSETVSENNQKWIVKDTTEGKEIINAFDITQNLRLNSTNDAFVVSSDDSLSKAYLVPDGDNSNQFTIKAIANGLSRAASYLYLAIVGGVLTATAYFGAAEKYDISSTADAPSYSVTSFIPSYLVDRKFNLKNDDKYITYSSNAFTLENKSSQTNQIFVAREFSDGPTIACFDDTSKYLSMNSYSNDISTVLPTVDEHNVSLNIRFEEYRTDQYFIHSLRYDKFLFVDTEANKLCWGNIEELSTRACLWVFEDAYILEDSWLKLYFNKQNKAVERDVEIPDYAYIKKKTDEQTYGKNEVLKEIEDNEIINVISFGENESNSDYIKVVSFDNVAYNSTNEIPYVFTNKFNWFTAQPTTTAFPYVNVNAYNQIMTLDDEKETVKFDFFNDVCVDENGLYWIAVGPNVVNPIHKSNETPAASEMYGKGTLDIVLKRDDNVYYVRCRVGGTKAHTWNNGVFQTWFEYPDAHEFETYATSDYNGSVCAEFMARNGLAYDINYSECLNTLGQYEVEKIIFYDKEKLEY